MAAASVMMNCGAVKPDIECSCTDAGAAANAVEGFGVAWVGASSAGHRRRQSSTNPNSQMVIPYPAGARPAHE